MDFIAILEGHLGRKAKKNFLPMQAGDVPATFADVDDLMADADFKPATPIEEGIGVLSPGTVSITAADGLSPFSFDFSTCLC